jgi:hypothetical protein
MISIINKLSYSVFLKECIEESRVTIVHCLYEAKFSYLNSAWVNIWKSTFLFNVKTDEEIQLMHAINVPIAPAKHYLDKGEAYLRFTLLFPAIPVSWDHFDLVEITATPDSGFRVYNIDRTDSAVYHIKL